MLLNQPYNSAVDIWSSACIIAELFSRQALFPGTSERNQLEKIFSLVQTHDNITHVLKKKYVCVHSECIDCE